MSNNILINKTREVLVSGYDPNRLCANELSCIESEVPQNCILVFGINPAGDENDAKKEANELYLYYLPETNIDDRTYSKFYKPIFETISTATNGNAKWGWCNYSRDQLNDIIEADDKLKPYSEAVKSHYNAYCNKKYSIYIGEFFYYHMTSQAQFLNLVDISNINTYFVEMLNLHIDEIIDRKNTISCIFINNATASRYLSDALNNSDYRSSIDYKYKGHTYRIIFGSMLSGRRSMDVFSKDRLINEMREYVL